MSEEEKQAIGYLLAIQMLSNEDFEKNPFEIILNLIEKQQKEIDKLKFKTNKSIKYIKEKQKIQYKYALSQIECDELLSILESE